VLKWDAAEIIVEAMAKAVSAGCAILTHEFRGAASRVPVEATAFGLRRDHVLIESSRRSPTGRTGWKSAGISTGRDTRQALKRIALPGGYPNLLGAGEATARPQAFGRNAERLAMVKRTTIPARLQFRDPAATGSESCRAEQLASLHSRQEVLRLTRARRPVFAGRTAPHRERASIVAAMQDRRKRKWKCTRKYRSMKPRHRRAATGAVASDCATPRCANIGVCDDRETSIEAELAARRAAAELAELDDRMLAISAVPKRDRKQGAPASVAAGERYRLATRSCNRPASYGSGALKDKG